MRSGLELGPWVLLDQLGRGGRGVVWRARHGETGQEAALKLFGEDSTAGGLLEEEFRLLKGIQHENLAGLLDFGEVAGMTYQVIELVEGVPLDQLLSDHGVLPVSEVVDLGLALTGALAAAHSHGVIHRDVKPDNILVPTSGFGRAARAVLIDFGLAGRLDEHGTTRAGGFVGTLQYATPEQVTMQEQGPWTDVYGLGAVLYHALYGNPPFWQSRTTAEQVRAIVGEDVLFPHEAEGLRPILARCLAREAGDRYATMAELSDALLDWRLQRNQAAHSSSGAPWAPGGTQTSPVVPSGARPRAPSAEVEPYPEDMSLSAVAPEESPESPPPPASSSLPRTGPLPHRPPPPPAPWPPVAAAAGGVTATLELRPAGLDPAAASWHPDDWDPDGTMFEDDEEEGAERAFASLDPPGSAPRRGGWLARPRSRRLILGAGAFGLILAVVLLVVVPLLSPEVDPGSSSGEGLETAEEGDRSDRSGRLARRVLLALGLGLVAAGVVRFGGRALERRSTSSSASLQAREAVTGRETMTASLAVSLEELLKPSGDLRRDMMSSSMVFTFEDLKKAETPQERAAALQTMLSLMDALERREREAQGEPLHKRLSNWGIFLTALLPVLVLAEPVFDFVSDWLRPAQAVSELGISGCVQELRANETVHFTASWSGAQPEALRYTWNLDGEELGFGAWVNWQAPLEPEPRSYRLELKEEIDGAAVECVFTVRGHEG